MQVSELYLRQRVCAIFMLLVDERIIDAWGILVTGCPTWQMEVSLLEDLARALALAVQAALEAGETLRKEFRRKDVPRESGDSAHAEKEIERLIADRLLGAMPGFGFCGEETGMQEPSGSLSPQYVWLVDPNDGTSAFLDGARGSSVSIGLLRDGVLVLGVVYSPLAPDDDGDLFAWAEGCGPIIRNGKPVARSEWPEELGPRDVVLLARHADRASSRNAACVAPGRFRAIPSIAYRLALAAAGEAAAAVSVMQLGGWDYAAGHAFIRAAGGAMVDGDGSPIRYSRSGRSSARCCFAGSPSLTYGLRVKPWEKVIGLPDEGYDTPPNLVGLRPGESISDAGLLRRAQGCLLGQLAGDNLGGLVEFRSAREISRECIGELRDGGQWDILAGQPTDDSELALCLARAIVEAGEYDVGAVLRLYHAWYRSSPFDIGNTIGRALRAVSADDLARGVGAATAERHANADSQANGSLMRISPLGVYAHQLEPERVAELSRQESRITHPNLVCQEACAAFVVAISTAIGQGAGPSETYARTVKWAESSCRSKEVVEALLAAAIGPPRSYTINGGWVLTALRNAFYQLTHAPDLREGVIDTVCRGGDTDTNAAIAGALLGAVYGRDAVPKQWMQMILTCRPVEGLPGVRHPRPRFVWPVDALELAERLLIAGKGLR